MNTRYDGPWITLKPSEIDIKDVDPYNRYQVDRASTYDIPRAMRGIYDSGDESLSIEFNYGAVESLIDWPLDSKSIVVVSLGKESGRLFRIRLCIRGIQRSTMRDKAYSDLMDAISALKTSLKGIPHPTKRRDSAMNYRVAENAMTKEGRRVLKSLDYA